MSDERFKEFKSEHPDGWWYSAGFPSYPRNFSRDVFVSAILSSDSDLLTSQLEVSSRYQAQAKDKYSGGKPGKIHHEIPGVSKFDSDNPDDNPLEKMDYHTMYNACDTNGLYLINAEQLLYGNSELYDLFIRRKLECVQKAADYILSQTGVGTDYLYTETPPEGADFYRLRVTYWKDSILPNPEGKLEPVYPVFYPQAHFIAARGLLSASKVLKDEALAETADKMFQAGITAVISDDNYLAYKDSEETHCQPSSDELHSLAYIPDEYADLLPLEAISERAAEHLATPFGYACTPEEISNHLTNQYHGYKIWLWEQAFIAYGARKYGLKKEAELAAKSAAQISGGQELLGIKRDGRRIKAVPEGNSRQLFSLAAREYLSGRSLLAEKPWL